VERTVRRLLLPALLSAVLVACGEDRPVDPGPDPNPAPPTAPTDVYVLPGPETDGVTVIAQGVAGASSYVFYRSTESGFTVGPSTLLGSNNDGGWVDRPLAAGTYYYRVTAYNDAGESAPSAEAGIVFAPGFAVQVNAPGANGLGADDLRVVITIVSDLELAEVTADVGGHGAVLAFAGETGAWQGTIDLREVARGVQRLAFSITDVQGHTVRSSVPFYHDNPPALEIAAPRNYELARPNMHLQATCIDDGGCVSLAIDLVDATLMPFHRVFAGTSATLNADLPLFDDPARFGTARVRFIATDNVGQADTVYRLVAGDSPTAALEVVATVPGRVLDVDADRILYLDSTAADTQAVRIRDRSSGNEVTVSEESRFVGEAHLMPGGNAIFLAGGSSITDISVFEWRNGALTDLGRGHGLRVDGPFAVYLTSFGTTLVRRNVSSGSSLTIAAGIYNAGHDVAADGDVVYSMPDTLVYRFQDGAGSAPISPPIGNNTGPATDGSSVVYSRRTGVNRQTFNNIIEIELFDGTNTIALVPPTEETSGLGQYTITNGWVAFTRPGSGGQPQVWTRSPGGEERQATFLGLGSGIAALGPNGEVVSSVGAEYRYAAPPYDGAPVDAGGGGGFVFLNGELLKLVGNTVFRVGS
jgi:hypothetical protein